MLISQSRHIGAYILLTAVISQSREITAIPSLYVPLSYVPQSLCSPVSVFPCPMFPSTYVPRSYVPQSLCSPVSMFPGPMFPSLYAPPPVLCSAVPMFTGTSGQTHKDYFEGTEAKTGNHRQSRYISLSFIRSTILSLASASGSDWLHCKMCFADVFMNLTWFCIWPIRQYLTKKMSLTF